MKDATASVIVPDTFAKAGEALKQLNVGESPDLSPCAEVAAVLNTVRTKEGFDSIGNDAQERLRTAAATINPRFERNETMLLNFFSEAFGATKRPANAEELRRDRIGNFLLHVAAA